MRLLFAVVAICLFSVLTHASSGEDDVNDSDVIVLTDTNFNDVVNEQELILVEFYAPWCGHCKHLKPAYAEAATILKANNPPIPIAKVDCTVETAVAGRFGISGYPTLKVFRNGKPSDYNGPRDAKGIAAFMKKQVGPAAKPLSSVAEVEAFISSDPDIGFAVVGFFPESKTSQLASSFALVASKSREKYIFGKVTDIELCRHYGVDGTDTMIAFKNFDDKKTVYDGSSKTKEVEDWIQFNALPVVGEFTKEKRDVYRGRGLPIAKTYFQMDTANNPKQTTYYLNRLKKVALKYKNKIIFTMANIKSSDFDQDLDQLGRRGEKEFLFVIEDINNQKNYVFEETFNPTNLERFLEDFTDGKLSPHVRSEKVPTKEEGSVKTVVGKNFDQVVNDPTKDVLIEFYAPWCGHCKSLAPKYEQLAKKMSKFDSVVVAKIDATANDYDRGKFEVKGYPTIYFVPGKQGAKPILYEGEREVAEMAKFIKKKAVSKPWKSSSDE